MAKISVCVSYYNQPEALRVFLSSIWDQTRPPDEVIVVDDGSTVYPVTNGWETVVKLQRHPEGFPAFAAVVNRGVERASGDIVFLLSSHWILAPEFVGTVEQLLLDHHRKDVICIPLKSGTGPISGYMSCPGELDNHTGYCLWRDQYIENDERFDLFGGVHCVVAWVMEMLRAGRRFFYAPELLPLADHGIYHYMSGTWYATRYGPSESLYFSIVEGMPLDRQDKIVEEAIASPYRTIMHE